MSAPRRYVVRLIGHGGQLVGHRYVLSYQAIDGIAAVSVPMAEMRRLLAETGGNTVAVLQPMEKALRAWGYDTLMVLPAQTQVVALHEVPAYAEGDRPTWEQLFDEARRLEVESAKLLLAAQAVLERVATFLGSAQSSDEVQELRHAVDAVASAVAAAYVAKG